MICQYCIKKREIWCKDQCKSCYQRLWKKTEKGQRSESRYLNSENSKKNNKFDGISENVGWKNE